MTEVFREINDFLDEYAWVHEMGVKAVVVLRGLPGSGKSTFAGQLAVKARDRGIAVGICSADDYFVNPFGEYRFNRLLVPTAHQECRVKFDAMLASNGLDKYDPDAASIIIVDNTNMLAREYRHYRVEAARRQDQFIVFRFACRDEEEAEIQGMRSIHQVPMHVVIERFRLFERFEDDIIIDPIYPRVDEATSWLPVEGYEDDDRVNGYEDDDS